MQACSCRLVILQRRHHRSTALLWKLYGRFRSFQVRNLKKVQETPSLGSILCFVPSLRDIFVVLREPESLTISLQKTAHQKIRSNESLSDLFQRRNSPQTAIKRPPKVPSEPSAEPPEAPEAPAALRLPPQGDARPAGAHRLLGAREVRLHVHLKPRLRTKTSLRST